MPDARTPGDSGGFVVVSTTVAGREDAARLAGAIIDARLAACVHCLPVSSTYRWEGRIENTEEHLLLCKTRAALCEELFAFIRQRHAYDVPELAAWPISAGSEAYLAYLAAETAAPKDTAHGAP